MCVLESTHTGVRCVVHGDDFTFAGSDEELEKCSKMMSTEYDVKVRGKLGPDKTDDKAITILNRCVTWTDQGIQYEADPRHVEILINEMESHGVKPSLVPGSKSSSKADDDDPHLVASQAT